MSFLTKRNFLLAALAFLLVISLMVTGCQKETAASKESGAQPEKKKKETIVIAGSTWDSAQVNAEIAAFILKHGYGYNTNIIMASSMVELQQHAKGEIDVRIENWTKSYGEEYTVPVGNGSIIEIAEILPGNSQGLYVPTFLIKGDPVRGIKPLAPELKSVYDLPKYWNLFKDPEDPNKGRLVGAPTTWSTNPILTAKMDYYGLNKNYNLFIPGSDPALATAIAGAVEKGQPVLAYYWAPTWLLGKYDLTLLEEPEYNEEKWKDNYKCAFPSDKVTVTVHKSLPETAPDVVELLKKFEMSSPKMNEILAYMQDNNAEPKDAAAWYLKNNKDTWEKWMPKEVAEKVNAALK